METICPGASVSTSPTQLCTSGCYQSPRKTQSRGYIETSDNIRKLKLTLDLYTEEKWGGGTCACKFKILSVLPTDCVL